MIAVARELPMSFGGFWYNDRNEIVVGLTDPKDLAAAERLIRPWVGANQPTKFVVELVEYPFLELAAHRTVLRRHLFELPGVVALGVNESENRIKIAIAEPASETAALSLLSDLSVPPQMVVFRSTALPREAVLELTDSHPNGKIQAGWQIERATGGACTLGFVALDPSDGYSPVFVTNTHCTETKAGFDGGDMFQPTRFDSKIGEEILDPAAHSCVVWGASFSQCRQADAALFSADASIEFASIVRTTTSSDCDQCQAGIVVDTANPSIAITGRQDNVFENERLDKIGRTTGWAYGAVEDTCDDVYSEGVLKYCNDRVDFSLQDGDSGSPVFFLKANGTAELRGIAWGWSPWPHSDAWMSDLNQIEKDLGSLWVFDPPADAEILGPNEVPGSAACHWDGSYEGRPPFSFEWRRNGVLVGTMASYFTSNTGTTGFQLSFKVTDGLSRTATDLLSVAVDPLDPGIMCS